MLRFITDIAESGEATGPAQSIQEPTVEIETSDIPPMTSMPPKASTGYSDLPSSVPNPETGAELSGMCLVKREVHCYSVLDQLMKDDTYTDVTITTDGHTFKAHKVGKATAVEPSSFYHNACIWIVPIAHLLIFLQTDCIVYG